MKDIDTLRAAIKAQQDAIKQAQATIRQARQHMDNASTELQRIAQGTGSPNAHGAIESTRRVHEHLTTSHGNTDATNQHLDDYLTDISGQQAWTSNDTAHPAVRNLSDRPPTPAPESRQGGPRTPDGKLDFKALATRLGLDKKKFLDAALTSERITELLEKLPKMKPGSGEITSGFWIDDNGRERSIVSGQGERVDHEYLDLDYQKSINYWRVIIDQVVPQKHRNALWNHTVAGHAEIKAAIQMRADNVRHASIVINNPDGPCGGKPVLCQELLKKYLRKGSTLTIYWPGGNYIIINGEG